MIESSQAPQPYELKRCFFRTLEPVHVGAGGYRLGRVDKTIVREPGTNLPKIPGTSLSGAARSYAALLYGKPEAAGAAKPGEGDERCPIFHTFGSATDSGGGQAGTVSIGDAHPVFWPVATLFGRVWVASPSTLRSAGCAISGPGPGKIAADMTSLSGELGHTTASPGLNLGWLWFDSTLIEPPAQPIPGFPSGLKDVLQRLVIVPDALIGALTNSNLEVRTSVAIDPTSGTAAPGKLFSYEAIPRDTVLVCEIIQDNYLDFVEAKKFVERRHQHGAENPKLLPKRHNAERIWRKPLDVALHGLELMSMLGVGGMGTRGFGRMELINKES